MSTRTAPRLNVTDDQGQRTVVVDKPVFSIGRRTSVDLQVLRQDVSKLHAEVVREGDAYQIRDCGSRFGTFVNSDRISEPHTLAHGDHVQLGPNVPVDIVFVADPDLPSGLSSAASSPSDLRQLTAILDGLRALGSGRVVDEVLTLVLDSALDVTSADRGFVMLADADKALTLKAARNRGHRTLPEATFATTRRIPLEVYATGESRMVGDLSAESLADQHQGTILAGVRQVLCVPLRAGPRGTAGEGNGRAGIIGVLYLEGQERQTLVAPGTRQTLEAFATQAALAIESARLYAEEANKARLERDLQLAARMQRALLPPDQALGATWDLAASATPCRMVGGDFFDYLELGAGQVGAILGDVAGKGPSAALLAAAVQTNVMAHAPASADPADTMTRVNHALLRRAVDARFATMFYATLAPDGRMDYSNAGQEPPIVVRAGGRTERLTAGGPVLGVLPQAFYDAGTAALAPGDLVVVYSDGVTEALDPYGTEYGQERMTEAIAGLHGEAPDAVRDHLIASVDAFAAGTPQADDLTILVLRHRGA